VTAAVRPGDTLSELALAGQMAAEYPSVCRAVAGLAPAELPRAGRLLAGLDPAEVARLHPDLPRLKIAVTGDGTLADLVAALAVQLARHGLLADTLTTDFNGWVHALGDTGGDLHAAAPDLALCVLSPNAVFDELPVPWEVADVERAVAAKVDLIAGLATRFRAATRGTLVLNTMPLVRRHTAQLVDYRSRARLGAVWREANARLLRLGDDDPGVVVLDLEPLVSEGVRVGDPRLSTYAKAHLTPELLHAYAAEVGHLARHLAGRTKKCLVLDLDETLWGGVLGDDGPLGIELGDGYRGEAFLGFQRIVRQLGGQGVLLAAVSKNEPRLVEEVLRDHPRSALRPEHFAQVIANWEPKHQNLVALAGTLNLGVDSFVFADDSAFERGLIRETLPGVTVLDLDAEPAGHAGALLRDGWFDTVEVTAEDRTRATGYRDEARRRGFLDRFDSVEDFLRHLDLVVTIQAAAEPDVVRVAQLLVRTNQFNLTTRRLPSPEVRALISGPGTAVLTVRVTDRFGDNGLVGALLTRREADQVSIDNFVLSCRVFARGVEEACLASVLRAARDAGVAGVLGRYRPGPRNHRVADLYPRHGFVLAGVDGDTTTFHHDLADLPAPPAHIRLVEGRLFP
jgi:FkbH-like protein